MLKHDSTKDNRIHFRVIKDGISYVVGKSCSADLSSKHEDQVVVAKAFGVSQGEAKLVDGGYAQQFVNAIPNIGSAKEVGHPAPEDEVLYAQRLDCPGVGVMQQFLHGVRVVIAFVVLCNNRVTLFRPFLNIKLKNAFHARLRGFVTLGNLTIPRIESSAL
jgi:hypothetical protein